VKKIIYSICSAIVVVALSTASVNAHVTIKPGEVAPGAYQVFTISVPNERDDSTVSVRLELPDAIPSATPTTAPGWTISRETTSSGDAEVVTALTWSDGQIPIGQRAEFSFSAKTPESPTTLTWKAYQTYADGSVVAWDQTDAVDQGHTDDTAGPASLTLVTEPVHEVSNATDSWSRYAFYIALAGFVISLGALALALRKR